MLNPVSLTIRFPSTFGSPKLHDEGDIIPIMVGLDIDVGSTFEA